MDNTDIVTEIDGFLSKHECDELIDLINLHNKRSTVASSNGREVSELRTSKTCFLDPKNNLVNKIHTRISEYLNIPLEKGECLQGQLYEVGQYFKPHHDYFHDGISYDYNCLSSGNRTNTLIIYLNDNIDGGETNFPVLEKKIIPRTGKAVSWKNMQDGRGIPESIHEGCEVKNGKKYIITSWWRENKFDQTQDKKKREQISSKQYNTIYNNISELPKCTEKGYDIIKCPKETFDAIIYAYEQLKPFKKEEIYPQKDKIIYGQGITSEILPIDIVQNFAPRLLELFRPLSEQFCSKKLVGTGAYGIRSYLNGVSVIPHFDEMNSHHICSILIVDKNLNDAPDWPLTIFDGEEEHKVYAEVGDIIIFESARLEHGRIETFQGDFFRNMFFYYKFA
jgi:prolyl 4-hydroxylase